MDNRIQCYSKGSPVSGQKGRFIRSVGTQWKDTQIAVVYTAILSGGQIGGIISGFLGEGFYICRTKPETLPQILLRKIRSKERWTNKQIFSLFSTLSTLSLLASAFVPNIYLLAVTYGIASVSLGVMFTMVIGFAAAGFRKAWAI